MDSKIILTFNSQLGKDVNMTIPNANPDIADNVVLDCMNTLVTANIFSTISGELVSPKSAKLASVTTTPITVAY